MSIVKNEIHPEHGTNYSEAKPPVFTIVNDSYTPAKV